MGICQDDFVKAFVLALSDDRLACKLQDAKCGQLANEVSQLLKIVKTRDEKVNHLQTEIDEMKSAIDENEQHSMTSSTIFVNNLRQQLRQHFTSIIYVNNYVNNLRQQFYVTDLVNVIVNLRQQQCIMDPLHSGDVSATT